MLKKPLKFLTFQEVIFCSGILSKNDYQEILYLVKLLNFKIPESINFNFLEKLTGDRTPKDLLLEMFNLEKDFTIKELKDLLRRTENSEHSFNTLNTKIYSFLSSETLLKLILDYSNLLNKKNGFNKTNAEFEKIVDILSKIIYYSDNNMFVQEHIWEIIALEHKV